MKKQVLLTASLASVSLPVLAETLPETNLSVTTVTATRTPTLVQNTIAQTTVIDEQQLQRYQGQSVLDVLRQQAGVYVTQNGGDGTSGGIALRGFSNARVLVLIDGIRYGSVSAGGASLSLLPADQIDRIEILHGASGTSLYGADAMGGVIQIFTKGQNAEKTNMAVTVGAGTENSYKGQVTGQLVNNNTTLSLSAGYDKTDGINATTPQNTFSYHQDKDGFESKNASLVAKHRFNESLEVGVTGLMTKSTTDMDNGTSYINAYADQENGTISGFVNFNQDKLSASLKYGQSFDKSTTYDGPDGQTGRLDDIFNTTQNQATLQLGYQLPVGKVIGGYEHLKQEVEGTTNYAVKDRTIKSLFAGYQVAQDKYDAQINLRHDDNSQFGKETTYNVGGAYRITPDLRVGVSYATGFRAPTLNDLYFPGYSNPNLKAETSKNKEVFAEYANPLQKTRLTAYQSDVKDRIILDANWIPQNIDKVDVKGVSFTSDWTVKNVLFGLSYDNVKAEDKAGKELIRQPKHKGLIYVGYQQPMFDVRAEVQHIGESFDNPTNPIKLDNYTLLNLSGHYYVNPNLTISSRLNNITGKDYETVYGYNQKGVNAFVSATYKWF